MFPTIVEIHQDMPSLVVVDSLPTSTVPIVVVALVRNSAPAYLVYLARRSVHALIIRNWATQQVYFDSPLEMMFNGQRLTGRETLEITAGSVFQLRQLTPRELGQPLSFTGTSGPSLDYDTHDTWSSLSADQVQETPGEPAQEDRGRHS